MELSTSFITKSEINLELLTSLLGSIRMQMTAPVIEATRRAAKIIKIRRPIFNELFPPEDKPMTQVVTDEKIIGIIDIEMKVRNISPKGFAISPKFGNILIVPIARNTASRVVYPLLVNFRKELRMERQIAIFFTSPPND
jgi:hypothetical protein